MSMGMHDKMDEDLDEDELAGLEDAKAEIEEKIKSISVKEDVDALTEGEELSEEFKEKAQRYLKLWLSQRCVQRLSVYPETYQVEKDQEVETFKEELTEKVDTYLNYVVDEWNKENELELSVDLKVKLQKTLSLA